MSETWRVIPDFPDYAVSDLGRIKRVVARGRSGKVGLILKGHCPPGKVYLAVGLVKDGRRYPLMVHRVVMDVFIGPRPEGHDRSHLDGNPQHNALANLFYEPHQQNNARKHAHGRAQVGERGSNAKYTDERVREGLRLVAVGATPAEAAAHIGCSPKYLREIASGKRWKHLNTGSPQLAHSGRDSFAPQSEEEPS